MGQLQRRQAAMTATAHMLQFVSSWHEPHGDLSPQKNWERAYQLSFHYPSHVCFEISHEASGSDQKQSSDFKWTGQRCQQVANRMGSQTVHERLDAIKVKAEKFTSGREGEKTCSSDNKHHLLPQNYQELCTQSIRGKGICL